MIDGLKIVLMIGGCVFGGMLGILCVLVLPPMLLARRRKR